MRPVKHKSHLEITNLIYFWNFNSNRLGASNGEIRARMKINVLKGFEKNRPSKKYTTCTGIDFIIFGPMKIFICYKILQYGKPFNKITKSCSNKLEWKQNANKIYIINNRIILYEHKFYGSFFCVNRFGDK